MAFLRRCREALRENGIIVIKDNLNSKQGFYVDKEDNSITRSAFHYASSSSSSRLTASPPYWNAHDDRSDGYLRRLFEEAGLMLVRDAVQEEFPPGMLPVRMYALRPASASS